MVVKHLMEIPTLKGELRDSAAEDINEEEEEASEEAREGSRDWGMCAWISAMRSLIAIEDALPKTPVVCKPFEDAYEEAFKLQEIDPERTLFFDDSVQNVVVASSLGLHCVLVRKSEMPEGIEYALDSISRYERARSLNFLIPSLNRVEGKAVGKQERGRGKLRELASPDLVVAGRISPHLVYPNLARDRLVGSRGDWVVVKGVAVAVGGGGAAIS
ncbi:hypothetical protein Droror1_Dr00008855 [Drosera rotundifolia]